MGASSALRAVTDEALQPADLETLLHEAEQAHGHLCAGQILGVRMAMLALARLNIREPRLRSSPDRKRLVTFVEIDRCATDAIGVVTGCRVGKRALKLRDWGKMAASFLDLARPVPGEPDHFQALRVVARESSKDRARALFPDVADKNQQQMRAYRELPDADLFSEKWVSIHLPPSEFPGYRGARVACSACGEGINFDRFARNALGDPICFACADPAARYYRPLGTSPEGESA